MSIKAVIPFMLMLAVFACKGEDHVKKSSSQETRENGALEAKTALGQAGPEMQNGLVKVRYFYSSSYRCMSCRKIERFTKKAIQETFSEELNNGKMEFLLVDMDKEENKHFIEEYKLFTKTVIVSSHSGQSELQWKNLTRVWDLLNNEDEFKTYVVTEVRAYL